MVRRIRRDVPTENSSIYTHGHLKKLDGVVTNYMSGIGTWEPISGAATAPAPPDKSVQFNDGLTAFGGDASFTFEKTTGNAALGANSSLSAVKTFNLAGKYVTVGNITDYRVEDVSLLNSSTKIITNGYGVYVNQPTVSGGGSGYTNVYGVYVADHSSVPSNLGWNIYSAGATSANAFLGESAFGTTPVYTAERATVRIAATTGNFNLYSDGNTSRNRLEGKLEVLGHSAFGSVGSVSTGAVVAVSDAFDISAANSTYSAITTGVTYDNTGGNASSSVYDYNANVIFSAGNASTVSAVQARTNLTSSGTVQSLFGCSFTAQWSAGSVSGAIVGGDFIANGGSSPTYIAGIQTTYGGATATNGYGLYVLGCSGATTNYGIYVTELTATGYNIWSDHTGATVGQGKNFFGAGAQIGATDLNISRFAANILGIGTGAEASVAGKLRCAGIGIGGNQSGSEELTVIGDASISVSLAVAGSISGSEKLTVTGDGSASGYWNAGSYKVGGAAGASGNFTTVDLKTVTVVNGLITSIV